ncbi:MAG TPA: hypothetical protein VNU26_07800 [Mycobacteriales bacterium]|nr:hypothetical protein [Mycobacteriales bacterium]
MYVWIWRHLPGGVPGKLLGSLLLLTAAVLVLFVWVFPAVEQRLPYSDVTVDAPTEQPTEQPAERLEPAPPGGSGTPSPAAAPTA